MKGVSTLIRFNVHILNTSLREKKGHGFVTYHHGRRLHEKSVSNQKIISVGKTHTFAKACTRSSMRTLPHKWQDLWLVLDCIFESLYEENFSVSERATRDQP